MVKLSTYHKDDLALEEIIQLPLSKGTIGLFYSPSRCQFGRWDSGQISDASGKPFALEEVFEARLFHPMAEVRWLRNPSTANLGRSVYLFESSSQFKGKGWQKKAPLSNLTVKENEYLLWGLSWKVNDLDKNWSCLAAARIGRLPVPLPNLQEKQRVRLKTVEYIGLPRDAEGQITRIGQYGNQVIVEERWLSLEVFKFGK